MVVQQAMASYMNLCGNEIVNAARLKAYVANGITRHNWLVKGCEGLEEILPCLDSAPPNPASGYTLPELDDAPWYDKNVPESKNFAGLLVTDVKLSTVMTRGVTDNIGNGATLGRLRHGSRTITVTGWLVGKTCCAVAYGQSWLTSALADPPCTDGDCGLDFLSCRPAMSGEDACIYTVDDNGDQQIYVREDEGSEYQRAEDFFRRINEVGLLSEPTVLECRGTACGCGACGTTVKVEFTLVAASAYINSMETLVLPPSLRPNCPTEAGLLCGITWVPEATCDDPIDLCYHPQDTLEDPLCALPTLPPSPVTKSGGCGCLPLDGGVRVVSSLMPYRKWGSSTLNFEVVAGAKALRNLAIRVWQNPMELDCSDSLTFPDCDACVTMLVSYVPAGATLRFSGERRKVTITDGDQTINASRSVTTVDGQPFSWPDIACVPVCAAVDFDCINAAPDSKVTIWRVERDL